MQKQVSFINKHANKLLRRVSPHQGQTLVEILIAMALSIVIITSMTIAVATAITNATYSKNQNLATQYAQEGIEIVKQMQTTNYATLSTLSGRYCLASSCSSLTSSSGSCGPNAGGNTSNCSTNVNSNSFIRQVDMLPAGSGTATCNNTIQATVSVLWTDGKCPSGSYCHSEQLVSCYSNTTIVPTP